MKRDLQQVPAGPVEVRDVEAVGDQRVFRVGKADAVQAVVGKAVHPVEFQPETLSRAADRQVNFHGIAPAVPFVGPQQSDVIAEKHVRQNSGAHQVQLHVAGNHGINGAAVRGVASGGFIEEGQTAGTAQGVRFHFGPSFRFVLVLL